MNDALTQLETLQANNSADATALATLESDLNSTAPTTSDTVLAAVVTAVDTAGLVEVFGAPALVSALEDANYTVTAPAPADAPELPESASEDASDTSTES